MKVKRPFNEITFLDIYQAVECTPQEEIFHFHEKPNQKCPVGRNIHHVLDSKLDKVQRVWNTELADITLSRCKRRDGRVDQEGERMIRLAKR